MISKWTFTLILIVIGHFQNFALAESLAIGCKAQDPDKITKSIDLRTEMPPMRDQGSIGWCYGFTGADLLSHYIYKTKGSTLLKKTIGADYTSRKFSVSGIGVATAYNVITFKGYNKDLHGKMLNELQKIKKKVFPESGTIAEALRAAKANGVCFEKDLSSEDYGYLEDRRCVVRKICDANDILNIVYDTPRESTKCADLFNIQKMFSSLDVSTIQKILLTSAREDAINNLVNASCKNRFSESLFDVHKGPVVQSYTLDKNNSAEMLMGHLDAALDQGRPVGIQYYADFLVYESKTKTLPHASTIVGKHFNTKTCEVEYILRNSWGVGCGPYTKDNPAYNKCMDELKPLFKSSDYDKKAQQDYFFGVLACKKNNPPLPRNPRVTCDETSHAIVKKSDLTKQIFNLTMIKEDNSF